MTTPTLEYGHIATLYHQGTNTYYRARIISSLTEADARAEACAASDHADCDCGYVAQMSELTTQIPTQCSPSSSSK